jgi:hypothetical protein
VAYPTIFADDYAGGLAFYTRVFGPPEYSENDLTVGWRLGSTWLTLMPSTSSYPTGVEFAIEVSTPEQVERLQAEMLAAGASGPAPTDEWMYETMRWRT